MINKVLVCITIQENSKRLINKGAELSKAINGELHILHVEKGTSIFDDPKAVTLLDILFELGKELGGEVHFVSDQDVLNRIIKMVEELNISFLVLGESMESDNGQCKSIIAKIKKEIPNVQIVILDREQKAKAIKNK